MKKNEAAALVMGVLAAAASVTAIALGRKSVGYDRNTRTELITSPTAASEEKNDTAETVSTASVTQASTVFLLININTATAEELAKLEGIGPAKAEAVVRYREEHSGFSDTEEIMQVDGIGKATYATLRDHIYVDETGRRDTVTTAETTTEPATEPETATGTDVGIKLEDIAPININTAGIDELTLLPYVDKEIAEKIIKLRNDIHGYGHVYELLYIDELTQKQVAEIVTFVTVGE